MTGKSNIKCNNFTFTVKGASVYALYNEQPFSASSSSISIHIYGSRLYGSFLPFPGTIPITSKEPILLRRIFGKF